MLTSIALFALSFLLGLLFFQVTWRLTVSRFPSWWISIFAGFGVGVGLSSFFYVSNLFLINASPSRPIFLYVEIGLAMALFIVWLVLRRNSTSLEPLPSYTWKIFDKFLLVAVLGGILAAVIFFLQSSAVRPVGDWDGWANWNLRAKFIAFGGPDWRNMFTQPTQPLHPDYPLLTPGFVARAWNLLGRDQGIVPVYTAALFTFGAIGLLIAILKELRGWRTALLAGLILACSTGFIRIGADQYGDVPLGFYFLLITALAAMSEIKILSQKPVFFLIGFSAGFVLWTKNEGLLIVFALIFSRLVTQVGSKTFKSSLQEWAWFLLGLTPLLLLSIYYHTITPANDMVAEPAKSLAQLFQPERYFIVWNNLNHYFVDIGKWKSASVVFVLLVFGLGLGVSLPAAERRFFAWLGLTVALVLVEYFFTYILTPRDLLWHIQSSLDRLLMHLYPTMLLLFFLLLNIETPESA